MPKVRFSLKLHTLHLHMVIYLKLKFDAVAVEHDSAQLNLDIYQTK